MSTFFKIRDTYFKKVPEDKFYGTIHGIGSNGYHQPDDYILNHYVEQGPEQFPVMVYNTHYPMPHMHGPPIMHPQ